jgi:hypothetical protein
MVALLGDPRTSASRGLVLLAGSGPYLEDILKARVVALDRLLPASVCRGKMLAPRSGQDQTIATPTPIPACATLLNPFDVGATVLEAHAVGERASGRGRLSRAGSCGRDGGRRSGSFAGDINVLALENVGYPRVEYAKEEPVSGTQIELGISALPTEVHNPFISSSGDRC